MNGLNFSSSILLLLIEDPKAKIIRIMHIIESRIQPGQSNRLHRIRPPLHLFLLESNPRDRGGGEKKGGRGRKALTAVLDNDANISAGKADVAAALLSPPQRAKRASSKVGKGKAAAEAPSMADELTELQGMLERLRLEKEKAEKMVRERDEVIRKKEEEIETRGKEQELLQAELKKMQRFKDFKPTVSFPLVKSLLDKDQEGDDKGKKKKGKGKAGHERKKPRPAYVLWCKEQWNEMKKEKLEADFKEVANALGTKWKALGAEEKQPYEERYRQEKEAYLQVVGQEKREAEAMKLLEEEQMQRTAKELLEQYLKFRQEAEDGDKKPKKKNKKEKDPSKPKQPMSAYFVYSQERRAALVSEKKNIGKITGEEWKSMTEAQKAPYEEVARKQKEEYSKQMEVYKQKKLEEAASLEKEEEEQKKIMKQEALQLLKKKEKADNISAIASQLACHDEKILITSINSLSKLVIRLSQDDLMTHLSTFLPALLDAFENHSPYVRKAVVLCLVDTYLKLGPAFLPYLERLDSARLQLVTTYANRLSQTRFIAVDV